MRLVVLTAVIVLAAGCGAAAKQSVARLGNASPPAAEQTTTTGSAASKSLEFARCMRAHGVPNFPDPSPGGGFEISPAVGAGSAFKAARTKCQAFLPGPPLGSSTHPTPQWLAHMRAVAQCMRHHGVSDFPDPTTTWPSSPTDFRVISDIQGAILAFPSSIDTTSPAFVQAAGACGFPLHNH